MEFKQIEAFVNVVRYKSFTKAADATFFTQPTISTHISTLEKELGTKLLERRSRSVEMTPQGRKFYRYAIEMVNTRAQAMEAIGKDSTKVEGVLEIQTSTIPGIAFLPEVLSGFHEQYPGTQFYVDLSDSQKVIENIVERRGEIGFVGDMANSSNIESMPLFSDNVVLIAPKSYGISKSKISMAEAVKFPFIWRESGSATRRSFEEAAVKLGYDKTAFEVVAKFNDIGQIVRAVEQGLGVSILSEHAVEKFKSDDLVAVDIEGFDRKRTFYMITLENISHSPVAEAFRRYVTWYCDQAGKK